MIKIIVFSLFIFINCYLFSDQKVKSDFVQKYLDIIPSAKENEFSSYESVVKSFIMSLKNNDIELSLKCFPIKEKFANEKTEDYINFVHFFYFYSNPVKDLDYYNLNLVLNDFNKNYNRFIFLILSMVEPKIKSEQIMMDPDSENYKKDLSDLSKMLNINKLKELDYSGIDAVYDVDEMDSIDEVIGVKEEKLVSVKIKIQGKEIPSSLFNIKCGKIGTNWKILFIMFM